MITFRFIFIWIAVFALMHRYIRFSRPVLGDTIVYYRWTLFWAAVLFFPFFWMACKGPILGDVYTYLVTFDKLPDNWPALVQYLNGIDWSGKGFRLFEGGLKVLFGSDREVFRIGMALVHSIPLVLFFRRYSENYPFSLYLFMAAGCLNSWMMNGLRQFMAVVIILTATPLLLNKQYLKLILVILLASLIHTSALVMLPIVFICQGEAWNTKTVLYILMAVVAAYLFSTREGLFDMMLESTEYHGTMQMATAGGDDGMNPIRVMVLSAPMLMAFFCRRRIKAAGNPMINICINMSVITTGISLIAMVTSGIMTGRLPIYTEIYSYILLPYLLNHGFYETSRKVMIMLVIILYFGYYWYGFGSLLL